MFAGKIFGIGFHKTGTSSLGCALQLLGLRVCGEVGVYDPDIATKALDLSLPLVDHYDAFQDNPWPLFYQELDRCFPHSKFILTERDEASWIRSVVTHFGYDDTPMREWIYGVGHPKGHETRYLEKYRRHNADVVNYFRCRPGDLLVFRLTHGDGWLELCRFLDCDIPSVEFPHANRTSERETSWRKLKRSLKRTMSLG